MLQKTAISACILGLLLTGCDKDKFETVPQLSVKEINGNLIPVNAVLVVTLKYTDREGDVDNQLTLIRERTNRRSNTPPDVIPFPVPQFPDANQGEITIQLDYHQALTLNLSPLRIQGSNPPKNETDTLRLKFVLMDQAGNTSDTAVVNNIFVVR